MFMTLLAKDWDIDGDKIAESWRSIFKNEEISLQKTQVGNQIVEERTREHKIKSVEKKMHRRTSRL